MVKARPAVWWAYLVRCGDGSLYAGATNDLERRVRQHAAGKGARYTRSRPPIALVWSEAQPDRSAALKREAALKRLRRAAKEELVAALAAAGRVRRGVPRATGRAAGPVSGHVSGRAALGPRPATAAARDRR